MIAEEVCSEPIVAPPRRLRQFIVSADVLCMVLWEMGQPDRVTRAVGMPSDPRVVGVMLSDRSPNQFRIIVESETFEPIREGDELPWLAIELSTERL